MDILLIVSCVVGVIGLVLLGIDIGRKLNLTGDFIVNEDDPAKDIYKVVLIDSKIDELSKKKYIVFRVRTTRK